MCAFSDFYFRLAVAFLMIQCIDSEILRVPACTLISFPTLKQKERRRVVVRGNCLFLLLIRLRKERNI